MVFAGSEVHFIEVSFPLYHSSSINLDTIFHLPFAKLRIIILFRQKMSWTPEHDVLLCREVLLEEPFRFKRGSRERGQKWERIADNLNAVDRLHFSVDQRAVRDRCLKIERKFRQKVEKEERTGSINLNPTELDHLMKDVVERSEAAHEDLERGEERSAQNMEREGESPGSLRKRPAERLLEARHRDCLDFPNKRQRTNEDHQNLLQYLREKNEIDLRIRMDECELKQRELTFKEKEIDQQWEIRKRDQELKEKEYEAREKREKQTLELLQQQIKLQQQQNQLLLDFMMKLIEKNV